MGSCDIADYGNIFSGARAPLTNVKPLTAKDIIYEVEVKAVLSLFVLHDILYKGTKKQYIRII